MNDQEQRMPDDCRDRGPYPYPGPGYGPGWGPGGWDSGKWDCQPKILRMMRELAGSELRNIDLYDYLLTLRAVQMGAQQNMFIIVSNVLRDNKAFAARNLMLIKETYLDITGENIEPIRQEFTQPTSYRNGVELVLFFEIDDVEDYRNLLLEITNTPYYNNVFEMMTNDLINVDRLNYLYARTILPGSM